MVVTILSKTGRKPTVGGKCFKESSKWLFTGLPTEFQAASVRRDGNTGARRSQERPPETSALSRIKNWRPVI